MDGWMGRWMNKRADGLMDSDLVSHAFAVSQ